MSDNFYKQELTPEEQKLNTALDQHRDALKDEMQIKSTAVVIYIVGLILATLGSRNSPTEHIGVGLIGVAVLVFVASLILGRRTRKYRYATKELLDAYTRKKAVPFYQELTELFASKPGLHLHLKDDGTIVVTDRRKQNG